MKRGVFIGSFNPPHKGHIKVTEELLENEIVDDIIFVPASNNYNKEYLIESKYRFEMLNIMCKELYTVLDIEIKKDTQNYTYQTLDEVRTLYPNDDIYLIIGSDNLEYFDKWMRYEYILSNYKVIVIERDNVDPKDIINENINIKKYNDNIIPFYLNNNSNLSSTYIRRLLHDGQDASMYLDNGVYEYIKNNNLYID